MAVHRWLRVWLVGLAALTAAILVFAAASRAAFSDGPSLVVLPLYADLSMEELADLADVIVVATVRMQGSASTAGLPVRRWELAVERVLKGDAPPSISITMLDDAESAQRVWPFGQPGPAAGQRAIFFLARADDEFRLLGPPSGYRTIDRTAHEREEIAPGATVDAMHVAPARGDSGMRPFGFAVVPAGGTIAPLFRWADGSLPVRFVVNSDGGSATIAPRDFRRAFVNGFATWHEADGELTFAFDGQTSERIPTPNGRYPGDRTNLMQWGGSFIDASGPATLAITLCWYNQGIAWDCDIAVNPSPIRPYSLVAPDDPNATIPPDTFDLLSVVIHEVGHFWGLPHSDEPGAVMSHTLRTGENRRTLRLPDLEAIQAVYGARSIPTPTATPLAAGLDCPPIGDAPTPVPAAPAGAFRLFVPVARGPSCASPPRRSPDASDGGLTPAVAR